MTPKQFDAIYWDSKHPDVRKLRELKPGPDQDDIDLLPARTAMAFDLVAQGHVVDALIDVHFAPIVGAPWIIMQQRIAQGYTWVPSVGTPNIVMAPGISGPQAPAYDPLRPPPRSIRVSLDPKDFPAFAPVAVAPPVDVASPVGGEILPGGGRYHSTSADKHGIGATWQGFIKRGVQTPFGLSVWWEKAS